MVTAIESRERIIFFLLKMNPDVFREKATFEQGLEVYVEREGCSGQMKPHEQG